MKMPTVALVGRPNVGKSTIFNKLVGKKISIIEDTPGVTRDRIYGDVTYKNYKFHLIDTGGIDVGNDDFNKEIIVQATLAIDEADVIVFILDGKEELNRNDFVIRDMLKKSNKRIILAVNKIDKPTARPAQVIDEVLDLFIELGADEDQLDFPVVYASALNGTSSLDQDVTTQKETMDPILDMIINKDLTQGILMEVIPIRENMVSQQEDVLILYNRIINI